GGRGGADRDAEPVGTCGGDSAVVGDNRRRLCLVELHRAAGDAGGEGERGVGGAEALVGGEPVAEGRRGGRVRGAARTGEGGRVVAGVGAVRVAVRVGRRHGDRLRAAHGLGRRAGDDEPRGGRRA